MQSIYYIKLQFNYFFIFSVLRNSSPQNENSVILTPMLIEASFLELYSKIKSLPEAPGGYFFVEM